MCRTTRTTKTDCHFPHEPTQDAREASLTRKEIRQGGEAQLRVDSPWGF